MLEASGFGTGDIATHDPLVEVRAEIARQPFLRGLQIIVESYPMGRVTAAAAAARTWNAPVALLPSALCA
jgi:hypothetical protein